MLPVDLEKEPLAPTDSSKPQDCAESPSSGNLSQPNLSSLTCEPNSNYLQPQILTVDGLSSDSISVAAGSALKLICKHPQAHSSLAWSRCTSGSSCSTQSPLDQSDGLNKTRIKTSLVAPDQLELEIDDFRREDSGDYYCSISKHSPNLSDSRVKLLLFDSNSSTDNDEDSPYSQETLAKLLPSLQVLPEFVEAQHGQQVQLICTTGYQDSDPDPSQISWTFSSLAEGRQKLLLATPVFQPSLPANLSTLGNVLVIWSLAQHHAGLYKCLVSLVDFNLTTEAIAEVSLRPSEAEDSAPQVYISPSLLRLSTNGSARIQCEASGYPAPDLSWFHMDDLSADDKSLSEEGIEVQRVRYQDVLVYCHENRCSTSPSDSNPVGAKVTSVSLLTISGAKGLHQGSFVCHATNKYGSSQVSAVVDVELREPPIVQVDGKDVAEQQVMLLEGSDRQQTNVSFKCSLISGRPPPQLRWLRKVNYDVVSSGLAEETSLDEYDLNRVSSATSDVTITSDQENLSLTLTMQISSSDDQGDYVCLAENEWGKHSAIGRLVIRRPISVSIAQASPFVARVNQSFHLECIASGYPLATDIEWSRGSDLDPFFTLTGTPGQGLKENQKRIAVLKFDRVATTDSGEYTCSARDPLNLTQVVRDTIMLIVEQSPVLVSSASSSLKGPETSSSNDPLPELMVSPTKIDAQVGSNVTIDCLAIAGPQPTRISWIGPEVNNRSFIIARPSLGINGPVAQFGTKLRITNMSKEYEGVYDCQGSNRFGMRNALALINLLEEPSAAQAGFKTDQADRSTTKTKMAKAGSNIELKCQVSGAEQLATSWSRDGRELPLGSVQLGHNLWIRNVSAQDDGLYVCLARSSQSNKVIQARINLLVQGDTNESRSSGRPSQNLSGRIVASRSSVNVGDSITLECIVSNLQDANKREPYLSEIENGVVWTNSRSGQTLFQDNVYIQGNLLIIYELREENSAIYRCNYNELSQHVDYKLVVDYGNLSMVHTQALEEQAKSSKLETKLPPMTDILVSSSGKRAVLKQVALGSPLVLECPLGPNEPMIWKRSNKMSELDDPVSYRSIKSSDADLYQCFRKREASSPSRQPISSVLVQVLRPAARFTQRPVSFVTLPGVSGAEDHLGIELKILADREHGLILFSGHTPNRTGSGDYISLGLIDGYLDFRFELGDGGSSLKSLYPLALHQWHRVIIERDRRGATMWVDRQPPVSNSSPGKFFNLDLDDASALYVGGHELFLQASKTADKLIRFQGYSSGFQGCIGHLKINSNELQLMTLNRSAAIGVYECEQPECRPLDCGLPNGICQVDWSSLSASDQASSPPNRTARASEIRCICMPDFGGSKCDVHLAVGQQVGANGTNQQGQAESSGSSLIAASSGGASGACKLLERPCSPDGSLNCQSLTSSSYKCHCKIGYTGDTCAQQVSFASETSLLFNQYSYVHIKLNGAKESESNSSAGDENSGALAKLSSMSERQEIAFRLQTTSSYGLIFYTGHAPGQHPDDQNDTLAPAGPSLNPRATKSMFVNLLSRLSSSVFDYLAIALIDGHLELSYELGSGMAIIRSSERINDGQEHQIRVVRNGRFGSVQVDDRQRYEGNSPGKFTMLNIASPEIYLAGLPRLSEPTNGNLYMPGFVGCLGAVEINTLGPLNLIRSDHLSQLRSARNVEPCNSAGNLALGAPVPAPTPTAVVHKGHTSASPPLDQDDPDDM